MTTAAAPRPPSPGDVADRLRTRRAAERMAQMLAPAELRPKEAFRGLFGRAIRDSGMTPHTRLVALVLATYGHHQTGRIRTQPGLHGLAAGTGLTAGQVVVALRVLESRGWVSRSGPAAYERTELQPHIPNHVMDQLRAARTTAQTAQPTA